MNAKELIDYLQTFEPDAEIGIMVANPPRRMRYKVDGFFCVTDAGCPALCIGGGDGIPFDEGGEKGSGGG